MKNIITLDTRWVRSAKIDGIGRYSIDLLKGLLAETKESDNISFLALCNTPEIMEFIRDSLGSNYNLDTVVTPHPLFSVSDLVSLPFFLKDRGVALYHALNMFFSPFHTAYPVVATVHDLIPVIYPTPFLQGSIFRKMFFSSKTVLSVLLKRAEMIASDSENTSRDMLDIGLPASRVIYPGIQDGFAKYPLPEQWEEFCTQHGILKPFILFVGRMDKHKGLVELLKAYSSLPGELKRTYILLIVGKREGPAYEECQTVIRDRAIKSNVLFLGHTDEEELRWLYSKARIFAFPSLYEGFGLPLIEAMASGVPIVAGNAASIPEIAMNSAILANPLDVTSYKNAMIVGLTNEKVRKRMLEEGMRTYKKFSWKNTASQTLCMYKDVLKSKSDVGME